MGYPLRFSVVWLLAILAGAAVAGSARAAADVPGATNLDQGWRLWLDRQAAWKDDTLYLPDEVDLAKIPAHPPTGGWPALSADAGIPVNLPATVEQYFWSKNAGSASPERVVEDQHAYFGVSWWYRSFDGPALRTGERLTLYFPAARLRAEVYVNGRLVGYNLITELPFTVDATDAVKPGQPNTLAVRITNPGGNFRWDDFSTFDWGKYKIPFSHGFGGLAGGVTMAVRSPVSVGDLVVLNTPDVRTVHLTAKVDSSGEAYDGPVDFSIRKDGTEVWHGQGTAHVPAQGSVEVSTSATVPEADLWDIGHPALYTATATIGTAPHAARSTDFGFRWLTATGVGSDAKLNLNGRRIVVRSAISWGFWAPNGMFPDAAAAGREVAAVQAIGLNCIQNHRHMPKEIVLDAFDRAGLMRYCEGGAGCFTFEPTTLFVPSTPPPVDASGQGGDATEFYEKYERAKIYGMVRAFRSHPSVIVWTVQNETQPDLHNPKLFQVLRTIHQIDPSRIVLLKSGVAPTNQAWMLPYSDEVMHDDGKGVSGWMDEHTAGASGGGYEDGQYKGPDDYLYHTDDTKEITTWGEMATGASPDDHVKMAQWYRDQNIPGYDRQAHELIAAAYDAFLDKYQFHDVFPNAEALFQAAGARHYFGATRMMENARIDNATDYAVLSGWESTTLDNHSGLVDALREPKGDPASLHEANASKVLVVRPRHLVVAKGDAAVIDVHLVNEENLHGAFTLAVSAKAADGTDCLSESYPVSVAGGETFGQLLKGGITFTTNKPGFVTVTAKLIAPYDYSPVLSKSTHLDVVEENPAPLTKSVAYLPGSEALGQAVAHIFNTKVPELDASAAPVDTIVAAAETPVWKEEGVTGVTGAQDPGLFTQDRYGTAGAPATFYGLAPGPMTVELFFAESYWTGPGKRVFDIALNGKTVAKDFDIYQEAGGSKVALVKTFQADSPDGTLQLSVPHVASDNALFDAIRVTDSKGKVVRGVFRGGPYRDPHGDVWDNVSTTDTVDFTGALRGVLDRVRQGSRLILFTNGEDSTKAATALADAGVLTFSGMVGPADAPWMGCWYFGKKHWMLDGLPSNGLLDWPYQIDNEAGQRGDGFMIDAPGLEPVIGLGRDHSVKLGLSAAVVPLGKGVIVLCSLPGFADSFIRQAPQGICPVTANRMMYNLLK